MRGRWGPHPHAKVTLRLDFDSQELERLADTLALKVVERLRPMMRGKAKNQDGLLLLTQLIKVVYRLEDRAEKGHLRVKLVTDTLNKELPPPLRLGYSRAGVLLRELGLDKGHYCGKATVVWDRDKILNLLEKYMGRGRLEAGL